MADHDEIVPEFLCHYYEAAHGPFRSLSELPFSEAEAVLDEIRRRGDVFASRRDGDYMAICRELEARVRRLFVEKGGRPLRLRPHYLVVGDCPWLLNWYRDGRVLRIPLATLAANAVSFTYGDTFPAMRYGDRKPYRGQVYTVAELPDLIRTYGLPQVCNADGRYGPDRYIEAQVWADAPLSPYLSGLP